MFRLSKGRNHPCASSSKPIDRVWGGYLAHHSYRENEYTYWLISDLIPKKSEKFEFLKNLVTMFFGVKNWPIKRNFEIFRPRNFGKIVKKIENLRVDYLPEKSKILENFFFIVISVKFWIRAAHLKKFLIHESKVMKHILFWEHQ